MRFRPIRDKIAVAPSPAIVPAAHLDVWIEGRSVPRASIRAVNVSQKIERDINGQLFILWAYILISALFFIAVFDFGWRSRFLLAAGFFLLIGFMSFVDILSANRISYWQIDVALESGEILPLAVRTEAQRDMWLNYLRAA